MPSRAIFVRVFTIAAIMSASLLWSAPASAQTVTVAGAMPGKLSVGATGKAGYDIPIAVPPGIAGMEPNLSLSYSSGAGNGIAGMGWSISGLSAITRCRRTPAQDGQWGGIEYNANDRFCLGGKRLVAVAGTYGDDGTEYRTEIDGFLKIVSYGKVVSGTGVPGTSPEWFRVWTKSGRIMDFGATGDSRVEVVRADPPAAGEPVEVKSWAANRVADAAGNYMTLSYFEDSLTGAHRPVQIDYSFNDTAAVAAQSSVQFVYEARPDLIQGYPGSSLATLDVRLQAIRTYTDGALVRDYGLAYETGGATGRSRLTSVTECDGGGNCLVPTTFAWQPENAGFTSDPGYDLPVELRWLGDRTAFVDVNGDGLQDFMWAYNGNRRVWLNTGSGWVESGPEYTPPFDIVMDSKLQGRFADVNGDGLPDFVRAVQIEDIQHKQTWLNTGGGWQESAAYQPPFIFERYWTTEKCVRGEDCTTTNHRKNYNGDFVDLNGDGLSDFILAYKLGQEVLQTAWLNTGAGWQESVSHKPLFLKIDSGPTGRQKEGEFVDVNGDNLTDFIRAVEIEGVQYRQTWLNTGAGWQESAAYQPPFLFSRYWTTEKCVKDEGCTTVKHIRIHDGDFADLNGDGLRDFILASKLGSEILQTAWLNTGNGWQESASYKPPFFKKGPTTSTYGTRTQGVLVDVNGDGLTDFVKAIELGGGEIFPGTPYRATWLNTGTGWRESAAYQADFTIFHYWITGSATYGDFIDIDGDGLADFVRTPQTDKLGLLGNVSWRNNSVAPDQLLSITDSLGATATLSYRPLTDKTVYAKHTDAVFPVKDVQSPLRVVSEVSRDDGVGGQYRTAYTYAGARIDWTGRSIDGTPVAEFDTGGFETAVTGRGEVAGSFAPLSISWNSPGSAGPGYLGFRYRSRPPICRPGSSPPRASPRPTPITGWPSIRFRLFPTPAALTEGTRIAETDADLRPAAAERAAPICSATVAVHRPSSRARAGPRQPAHRHHDHGGPASTTITAIRPR